MKNRIATLAAFLALASWAHAADVAGKWVWVSPGRNGGPDRTNTLTLKLEGGKLSGNVAAPNREGKSVETAISDAKAEGETVAFTVVREVNGNSIATKYSAKVEGDKLTGKVETTRDGQAQTRDWTAKRAAEAK